MHKAISRTWGGGRVSSHRQWKAQAAGWLMDDLQCHSSSWGGEGVGVRSDTRAEEGRPILLGHQPDSFLGFCSCEPNLNLNFSAFLK